MFYKSVVLNLVRINFRVGLACIKNIHGRIFSVLNCDEHLVSQNVGSYIISSDVYSKNL